METVPCRLYVILARAAPVGVVFRRGPTKWVQLLTWHTDRDKFEAGQWLRARVYERRCDLSPDGSKLIYFAADFGRDGRHGPRSDYAWTAISRLSDFAPIALWPKDGTWWGGGLFEADDRVWLNHAPHEATPDPEHPPRGFRVIPNPDASGEDGPIWSRRMARDGWAQIQQGSYRPTNNGPWRTVRPEIWQRTSPNGQTLLRLACDALDFSYPGGPYDESYALRLSDRREIAMGRLRWADWDPSGRLVFARDGRLFAAHVKGGELLTTELIDLNPNAPHE